MPVPRRYARLWAERPVFVGLAGLTLAVLLAWPAIDTWIRPLDIGTRVAYYDYGAYSGTVETWRAGEALYVPNEDGGYHGSYLYPPITLLAFVPFTLFPFDVGATLLGVVSIVVLWLGLDGAIAVMGYSLRRWERVVLLGAIVGFHPVLFTFKMGQVPTLLTGLLALAFVTSELAIQRAGASAPPESNSRQAAALAYASGALTTLGSSMKLHYAPSGAHLLRDRRRLVGALGTVGLLVVASLAIFGVQAHLDYLDVLTWGKGWGTSARSPELWMPAYYRPLYVLGPLSLPVRILGVLGVIALALSARQATDATTRWATFALGVAAVPILAPKAYTQDLVILLLPAVVLLGLELLREDGQPWIPILALLLVHVHSFGLWLLVSPPAWLPGGASLTALAGWLQPGLWGTLLLVGLASVRIVQPGFRIPLIASIRG